jgi:hypothetical protein
MRTPPAPILLSEANDQLDQLLAHRRSPGAPLLPPDAPLALGCIPVPSQQRVRGDQEGPPPGSMEEPAECSEQRPIGRPIPDASAKLALENPEHHDLDVLVRLRAPGRHDEAEDAKQAGIDE